MITWKKFSEELPPDNSDIIIKWYSKNSYIFYTATVEKDFLINNDGFLTDLNEEILTENQWMPVPTEPMYSLDDIVEAMTHRGFIVNKKEAERLMEEFLIHKNA